MTKVSKVQIKEIPLSLVDEPPETSRLEIDPVYIGELAQSISEIGLIQAILVRPMSGRFEIVAGHRRFLAHEKLGVTKINATVREMTDQEAAIARGTENLGRVDLTPIEEANTYAGLYEKHGLSIEEIGQKMGKNPATVKRRLDLLRMHPILQKAVHSKQISMTVAEELWPIGDEPSLQYYLTFAIENGCTKDVARSWAKEWKDAKRRNRAAGEGIGLVSSPFEERPVYISCDVCQGPMKLGEDTVIRVCSECNERLKSAFKGN